MHSPIPPVTQRLNGLDLARSLAILGMIVVHFILVMTPTPPADSRHWVKWLTEVLDGRPAALFMVLTGVGTALRWKKADAAGSLAEESQNLLRRGAGLFGTGLLLFTVWTGDILRVYGVMLALSPWLCRLRGRGLAVTAGVFVLGFIGLMTWLDYGKNWVWATMTYNHRWTLEGQLRNLFYDGFRAVFPWGALFCGGLWLGRTDLAQPTQGARLFWRGLVGLAATVVVSKLAVWGATSGSRPLTLDDAQTMFGIVSMPPLPMFLLTGASFSAAAIGAGLLAMGRWPQSRLLQALAATGRMSFTLYLGHIVVGLGGVIVLELHSTQSPAAGVVTGLAFFAAAACFCRWWLSRRKHGPLESLLRRVDVRRDAG